MGRQCLRWISPQRGLQQFDVIHQFAALKILPLLQGVFLQEALAEAVDREDRRLIEMIERRA